MRKTENGGKPFYCICQLKTDQHEFQFSSYEHRKRKGLAPNITVYELVYIAEDSADASLDEIYERFNINRPEDFRGHSLSVSDVIVKFDGKNSAAYYVDTFGFQPLPDFFDSTAAKKKNMEM